MCILANVRAVATLCLLVVGFLTVQPLLPIQQVKETASRCQKERCSKKESQPKNNQNCQNKSCNPFIACAYGNFYVLETNGVVFRNVPLVDKLKTFLHNDNRLASGGSECWHPPQA
jgi:hypothetical protein